MLNKFITVLIIEITRFLTSNKDFFELSQEKREKALSEVKFPTSVKTYLLTVNAETFTQELAGILKYIKNAPVKLEENEFAKSICSFLVNNFANDVYSLPVDYFKLKYSEQIETVNKVIKSNSELAISLKQILTDYSYQEILNGIFSLLQKSFSSPLVIIQSPCEVDFETKKEIREKVSQETQKTCLPIFQVNKNLIGGLRIFVDGKVSDYSWMGAINLITSLK